MEVGILEKKRNRQSHQTPRETAKAAERMPSLRRTTLRPRLERITIDLDDGVKVNYEKVQTARGRNTICWRRFEVISWL